MKILHTEACDGWGGQELRIINESLGMIARGHELHIICPDSSDIQRAAEEKGIPVTTLPIEKKTFKGLFALRKWLKSNPVDVANTHSSTDSWLTALACLGLKNKPKIVRSRHISTPVKANAFTRWLYCSAASHIVTTGEAVKKMLVEENGFPSEQITSVPTGGDHHHFVSGDKRGRRVALNLPPDQIIVGIVAIMRGWKGHSVLFQAVAKLNNPNLTILIVGEGPIQQQLEIEAESLGIKNQVIFAGYHADVVPWLQAMDIFALPSTGHEGVPQGVVQAMMCELAAISTDVGGTTEAVIHEQTGLIVKKGDVDDLSESLQRLILDEKLRLRLGKQAREHVKSTLSSEIMIQKMEQIFQRVLSKE